MSVRKLKKRSTNARYSLRHTTIDLERGKGNTRVLLASCEHGLRLKASCLDCSTRNVSLIGVSSHALGGVERASERGRKPSRRGGLTMIMPEAVSSQYGQRRPLQEHLCVSTERILCTKRRSTHLNAVTKYTPPESLTWLASSPTSELSLMISRLSLSHLIPLPQTATLPSSAY